MNTGENMPKIAIIGLGKAGIASLIGILRAPDLKGCSLSLLGKNEEKIRTIELFSKKLNAYFDAEMSIQGTTDLEKSLNGADYIFLSLAVDREKCWSLDRDIALKYGINHFAENGGPGAFMHAARNLSVIMPILRKIEECASQAWLFNFTNPVARVCTAARLYTSIKTVGICHQIDYGYFILANLFSKELNLKIDPIRKYLWNDKSSFLLNFLSHKARQKFIIRAWGINHLTWMMSINDRQTGRDLYPEIREKIKLLPAEFEPLSRDIFSIFGYLPVPGDYHLGEYFPFTSNTARNSWEYYGIQPYNLTWSLQRKKELWERINKLIQGQIPSSHFKRSATEGAEYIISAMLKNKNSYEEAVNLPNQGAILNLPTGAIIETPALIDSQGPTPLCAGHLPEPIAEICRRQTIINQLSVQAIVEGSREKALQAFVLDPMIDDIQTAKKLLDEYLMIFKEYLKVKFD